MSHIHLAQSEADLKRCYPAMRELRPHLDEATLLAQVHRQMDSQNYRVAFVEDENGKVAAVAGFRIVEMLAWGKTLYVDDLVTPESHRGKGFGSALFDWLVAEARRHGCDQFHLDSGVHRHVAHRFYLGKGMDITSHHFAMKL